ncbi:MAG: hypothetical protein EXR68_02105 [Dehalococcoidia bacterium]|nr:hypothetical protein [Dehalococcoidia bacterium]
MSHEAIGRNEEERERFIDLGGRLSTDDLLTVVHGDWTIAATFAHIAFWDRFALTVLERWAAGQPFRIDVSDWYDDVLNDAALAESLALDPVVAARLAIDTATAVDGQLSQMSQADSERLAADAARPETGANWLLHRYRHRAAHLDARSSEYCPLVRRRHGHLRHALRTSGSAVSQKRHPSPLSVLTARDGFWGKTETALSGGFTPPTPTPPPEREG